MRLLVSWLRELVDAPPDPARVAARLAACGFEVASIEGDVIDFEITANRPDCLSVIGLAREAAAAFEQPLAPQSYHLRAVPGPRVSVFIDDDRCGRYAMALADVTLGDSPAWLADRLAAAGIRPINNVVDVTNYVMVEMGQPMHAFDAATLDGGEIHVRAPRAGETLTTLDGVARRLDPSMLVIADRLRPVALAGVLGGAATEVSPRTRRVAIESAWFAPGAVRAMSRAAGVKTEASARFERGADLDAAVRALARALDLLARIGAGAPAGPVVDLYPTPVVRRVVTLRRSRLAALLGAAVPDATVARVLAALGFGVDETAEGWSATVPTFRVDVAREVDLIEEVGRHWGLDRIAPTFPPLTRVPPEPAPPIERDRRLRRVLTGAGVQEAMTFTFIERTMATPFVADPEALVPLANPLSEKFAVLRPSLLPGLLEALVYNRHREAAAVRLFETGAVFDARGERRHVAWVEAGPAAEHWSVPPRPADFYDASGLAELVAMAWRAPLRVEPTDACAWAVRGAAGALLAGTATLGVVGRIRADIVAARGLAPAEAVYAAEIDLDALEAAAVDGGTAVTPLPRYPSVVRDLSIVVDERLPAAALRGTIRSNAPATLVRLREFDRYQGAGVPAGRASVSVRLTFRSADRTLTDVDVQQAVDAIVAALERDHGAMLRR